MLNRLDDYPIHQTPEPVAHPSTSDPNFYDRTWFNGYTEDRYFGIGIAVWQLGVKPRMASADPQPAGE